MLSVDAPGKRKADIDLGNAAVLPGLVNAHTHLDLTGLRRKVPPAPDFTQWLRRVIEHRLSRTLEQVEEDIQQGLEESAALGTTLLGDISARGASWLVLATSPYRGRAVVFYELLGLPKTRAHQAWAQACSWLRVRPATPTCRPGLSPHAPYSVRRSLFRAAANLARQRNLPVATHLAETQQELELLQERRGPFVDLLEEVDAWSAEGLVEGVGEILNLNTGVAHAAAVHANYLDPATPVPANHAIIYCPRTHAAFGHEPHPVQKFIASGVRVALGTDSLASNPDLDVLAEARFLHQKMPGLSGDVILRMATLSGAEALGWQAETGSLVAGKSADLVVVPLPQEDDHNPYHLLWESTLSVRHVLMRGAWTSSAPEEPVRP
ncbi:MAG: amidohydrolase [Planctomycetota bacterium]|nr:MAG: amidohydrolase [Planctomycetota bacterium]